MFNVLDWKLSSYKTPKLYFRTTRTSAILGISFIYLFLSGAWWKNLQHSGPIPVSLGINATPAGPTSACWWFAKCLPLSSSSLQSPASVKQMPCIHSHYNENAPQFFLASSGTSTPHQDPAHHPQMAGSLQVPTNPFHMIKFHARELEKHVLSPQSTSPDLQLPLLKTHPLIWIRKGI